MNDCHPCDCERVFDQLTASSSGGLSPELTSHLAKCAECRQLRDELLPASERLRQSAWSLAELDPSPITGPWQTQAAVMEVAVEAEASSLHSGAGQRSTGQRSTGQRGAGHRGVLAQGIWMATIAASIVVIVAVQAFWGSNADSPAAPLRQSTLVWSPVTEGQPSSAGAAFLASLQLPNSCVSLTAAQLLGGEAKPDTPDHWHPHLHHSAFDCCTRCHASGADVQHRKHIASQLLKTCNVCHLTSQPRESPSSACATRDCADCHTVSPHSEG